ncbi:AraC family transcriptional regulator [Acidimangrovimonas sediminis]|uniref:AraC family transcriptional regulator n=1 Tax=Acidimangrovimonas sediminis TaxID=2056283 RepID=UPI000C7FEAD4|nr:AraC family transcriptional regulator [Acidimangrovimonas sediminis]
MIDTQRLPEPRPFVRATALAPVLRHFHDRQAEFTGLLTGHGVDPGRVRDLYEEIPLASYFEVFEAAARLARDPVLGARLGLEISPADLGPTGLLLMQSSTIRRGLGRFQETLAALQTATDMTLSDDGVRLSLSYQIASRAVVPGAQDAEFSLSCVCRLIRLGFDRRWRPEEVHFSHPSSRRPDLLERLFAAPVRFGQGANRIVFGPEGLDTPHRTEDAGLIAVIERHVADLIRAREPELSLAERVRTIVDRDLGSRPVTLSGVAAALGLAPRSLQRHLAAEDTSLREIVRAERRRIGEQQLARPDVRLKSVAASLGYADETVLWRAWKDWTGAPPSRGRG